MNRSLNFFLNKCGVFEEIKYVKGKSDKRHLKKTYFILDIFRNDTHTFFISNAMRMPYKSNFLYSCISWLSAGQ